MLILCGDTSSSTGFLSLYQTDENQTAQLFTFTSWEKLGSHSDLISLELEKILSEKQLKTSDIDAYLCGVGPGSFTGIRVALNLIRGLAYIHEKPCLGITSPQLLMQSLPPTELPVLILINAFRNLVYTQSFSFDRKGIIETSPLKALPFEEVVKSLDSPHLVLGSGYSVFKSRIPKEKQDLFLESSSSSPAPLKDLGPFLTTNLKNSSFFNWKELQPLYIRDSEAEEKLRTGELKPVKLL